ncbi:MAG: helix-turn-helix domain-containing protein [Pseudomonadota bacterium]
MSERELNRVEVLSHVTHGMMTATNAANVLNLSRRQVHRLLKTFQTDGALAIRHKARGHASNNRIDPAVREFAVTLVRENYLDFGPTFATKKLLRQHGFQVSMSGKGNCYDNSAAETFFKTIKAELLWRRSWQTRREAEMAIFEYLNGFYNPRRRHSALGWKSPVAFERKVA